MPGRVNSFLASTSAQCTRTIHHESEESPPFDPANGECATVFLAAAALLAHAAARREVPYAPVGGTVCAVSASEMPCRLFIYGTLLPGERDHALLSTAEHLGPARTEPLFHLVEVGAYAALVADGKVSVHGELYATDLQTRRQIDIARQVPILFQRAPIGLADGTSVEAYVMTADQVRGKRRLAHGDWRTRFLPLAPRRAGGPFVKWARTRFDK